MIGIIMPRVGMGLGLLSRGSECEDPPEIGIIMPWVGMALEVLLGGFGLAFGTSFGMFGGGNGMSWRGCCGANAIV